MCNAEEDGGIVESDTTEFDAAMDWLREQHDAEHPMRYFGFGEWLMIDEGMTEVRTVFGESKSGFHVGVEVSRNGGDGPTFWSDPYPTIEIAKANASAWFHRCIDDN